MKQTKEHQEALKFIRDLEKIQKDKLNSIATKREKILKENEKLEEILKDNTITYEVLVKNKKKLQDNKTELAELDEYEKIAKAPVIDGKKAKELKLKVLRSYEKEYNAKIDEARELLIKASVVFKEVFEEPMNNDINLFLNLVHGYMPNTTIENLNKLPLQVGRYKLYSDEFKERAKHIMDIYESYPMY